MTRDERVLGDDEEEPEDVGVELDSDAKDRERSVACAGEPHDASDLFTGSEQVDGDQVDPLAEALAQRDEYLEALRRLQAEFDNYRKRVMRQQTEIVEHGSQSLLARLLPVLDALDLAIAHGAGSEGTDGDELRDAVVQIEALLRDTLSKEGLERIDALGAVFDPTVHDAVAHVSATPDQDADVADDGPHPSAVVDDVLRAGYRVKGRVLRPAMVRVRG